MAWLWQGARNYPDLMMATPYLEGRTINASMINELNENNNIPTTYEQKSTVSVNVLNNNKTVNQIDTNIYYPFVMEYPLVSGRFFEEDSVNQVVLNEKAAFDLFGSVNIHRQQMSIGGDMYMVTGVIADRDNEYLNIYTNASHKNIGVSHLITNLSLLVESNQDHVRNIWSSIGVTHELYAFMNYALFREGIANNVILMGYLIVLYLIYKLIIKGLTYFKINKEKLTEQKKANYLSALIFSKVFILQVLLICGLVGIVVFMGVMLPDGFNRVLHQVALMDIPKGEIIAQYYDMTLIWMGISAGLLMIYIMLDLLAKKIIHTDR